MRLFEILDKLNQLDAADGKARVGVLPDVIEVNSYKNHGDIKIGLPIDVAQKLTLQKGNHKAILLVIDMDEYNAVDK